MREGRWSVGVCISTLESRSIRLIFWAKKFGGIGLRLVTVQCRCVPATGIDNVRYLYRWDPTRPLVGSSDSVRATSIDDSLRQIPRYRM